MQFVLLSVEYLVNFNRKGLGFQSISITFTTTEEYLCKLTFWRLQKFNLFRKPKILVVNLCCAIYI